MLYEIKYYKEMLLLDPKKYITIDEFSIVKYMDERGSKIDRKNI